MSYLAKNLAYLRNELKLSQKKVAEKIHLSREAYGHFETGSPGIYIHYVVILADFYAVSIDELVHRDLENDYPAPGEESHILNLKSWYETEKALIDTLHKFQLEAKDKIISVKDKKIAEQEELIRKLRDG